MPDERKKRNGRAKKTRVDRHTRRMGLWTEKKAFDQVDKRRAEVRYYRQIRDALIEALGGSDLSPMQISLIDDFAFYETKTRTWKQLLMEDPEKLDKINFELHKNVSQYFLSWMAHKRRVLETLGIKTVKKEKDLTGYIQTAYGDKPDDGETHDH